MGTIWVQEFTGGLDTRRLPETTVGGVLIRAQDGHISRGGEFEKRAAFVETFVLPPGTVGLAVNPSGPVVFGPADYTAIMPDGMQFQPLAGTTADNAPFRIPSYDLYAGKLYVVAEFGNGTRRHFYDGAAVDDWYDGRSRAAFRVVSGGSATAAPAKAYADVISGTAASGNQITAITVAGVPIINAPITHTGNNVTTAAAIATAVNAYTSTPDYTAAASGVRVTLTAVTPGSAINGQVISVTTTGDFTIGNGTAFAGGADGAVSRLEDLKVNAVSIMLGPVTWVTSNAATATAIADSINSKTSAPDYTATAVGDTVNVISVVAGAIQNTYPVAFTLSGGFQVSPATGLTLSGGDDSASRLIPGDFVRTVGTKVYSTSAANLHFSGVAQPTKWTTDTTGAGFIDFSAQASGLEKLTSLVEYQSYLAVFAERAVVIEYVDPDPLLNKQSQILRNTGTGSPLSVTQFGDADVFYLDTSGIRSLRARDASNAAATSDVGNAIDALVSAKMDDLNLNERLQVIGLIEPRDGRFWLIAKDTIFVFSFFSGAKVSAWSTYQPGFDIEAACVYQNRVYLRSGDSVFVYGGVGLELVDDPTVEAEAWLPYLDASKPTTLKHLEAIDAAVVGEWEVSIGLDPTNIEAADVVGRITKTTFGYGRIPISGAATHISPRFRTKGPGPHKLAAVVLQDSSENADAKR